MHVFPSITSTLWMIWNHFLHSIPTGKGEVLLQSSKSSEKVVLFNLLKDFNRETRIWDNGPEGSIDCPYGNQQSLG